MSVNQKFLFQSFIVAVLVFFGGHTVFSQGTAFLYQGQLTSGGSGANGNYDFEFVVSNSPTGSGQLVNGPVTESDVAVSNGLFTTTIDFGANVFIGESLWLSIEVRPTGGSTYTQLLPLQPILPVPYAIFAESTTNLTGTLAASQIAGTLPASAFAGYTNTVAFTNANNVFSGTFSGNGAGVVGVNVANLTGVLVDAQLPTNTAYVNSNQTFTANNTFNGANNFTNLYGNSFSGSFFGNGLVGWIVVPGTSIAASIDHGYLLTNSQTVTVVLPTTANPGDIVRISDAGAGGWQLGQNPNQSVLGNFLNLNSTWSQIQQYEKWTCLAESSDGTKLAAGAQGGTIYYSLDSGATWSASTVATASWQSIASANDGYTVAAGATNGGSIYISTNSGASFTAISGSGGSWFSLALSSDGTKMVAADYNVGLYTYAGTTRTSTNLDSPNEWSSVASSANGKNLVAANYGVASGSGIYISGNGGSTWTQVVAGNDWTAVTSSADGTRLAATSFGEGIETSANSGLTWAATTAPAADWVSLACSSDGSKLIAAVSDGSIYTSENWGATWVQQTNRIPTATTWSSVASSSSGTSLTAAIYGSTTAGGFYTSTTSSELSSTTAGTNGYINGAQGSAVELQCVSSNLFMPVSSSGTLWAH